MSERGGDAQRAVDAHTLGAENDIKPSEPVAPVEPTPPAKVVVFGSGSFGTALGTLVARNGYDVVLLTRREEVATAVNRQHRNPSHLTAFELPDNLTACTDDVAALAGATCIIHCIPVQQSAQFLAARAHLIPPSLPIVCTSKGLNSDTLETMHEIMLRVLGGAERMAFLSGPTFAAELMAGHPSGVVVASSEMGMAARAAELFRSPVLRVYTTTDVVGVEVGGALKNVFALMAGAVEGMGFGYNSAAMMVTLACREMNQVAVAMGAHRDTLSGLAGMGDLMLTCMGGQSRNRTVGVRLGRGESIQSILEDRAKGLEGVAEGVATAPAALKLVERHHLRAPMIRAMAAVLAGEVTMRDAAEALMRHPATSGLTGVGGWVRMQT